MQDFKDVRLTTADKNILLLHNTSAFSYSAAFSVFYIALQSE